MKKTPATTVSSPAKPTGVFFMSNVSDLGTINFQQALSRSYARCVVLFMRWKDLQPNGYESPSAMADRIGGWLNQLDRDVATVERSHVPCFARFYPTDLPAWVESKFKHPSSGAEHQAVTIETSAGSLPLHGVSYATVPGGAFSFVTPYSHHSTYQQVIHDLRQAHVLACQRYDPHATRMPFMHFVGPTMRSINIATPGAASDYPAVGVDAYWQTGAFAGDSVSNAWTKAKHLTAMQKFANELIALPEYQARRGVFNFTSSGVFKLLDQVSVFNILNGHAPTVAKQENMATGFYSGSTMPDASTVYSNIWRDDYNATQTNPASPAHYIQNSPYHGWEMWRPYTKGNGGNGALSPGYITNTNVDADGTPNPASKLLTQLADNIRCLSFTGYAAPGLGDSHTQWVELWQRDLEDASINAHPEFATFAKTIDAALRANALA